MPPKKRNGFLVFTFEWKEKNGKNLSLGSATNEAGKIWANMTLQERGPYNEKAKNDRISTKNKHDKLTCTGVPLSVVEKNNLEKDQSARAVKKHIENLVRESLRKSEIASQKYYFVMVNYFTKTLQSGVYLPAEISIAEYSLNDGMTNKYHSFVNPGINIYGHSYEAQHHSDTTHQLPLPPNAFGEENLGKLYNSILHFIRPNDDGEYPPLFTDARSIAINESALNFIKSDPGANNVDLKIYPIQYLFYTLKEATCEVGEVEKPSSQYVTDAYFERDIFEYMVEIACNYHETRDKNNYCTLSCVTRWCYTFSEYMTRDIAIKCIPGRHLPASTKATMTALTTNFSDVESCVSSNFTYKTKALSEHKPDFKDAKSTVSSGLEVFKTSEFPDLARSTRKPNHSKEISTYLDDEEKFNHWTERSRRVPPPPDKSHFKIDVSETNNRMTDLNESEDSSSMISFGRGRKFKKNFGRGNAL